MFTIDFTIDMYRDGGSISIHWDGFYQGQSLPKEVVIDYRLQTHTPGKWFFGHPSEPTAEAITDVAFKQWLIQRLTEEVRHRQHLVSKTKESLNIPGSSDL